MITPVLSAVSISKNSKTITLADTTGAYGVSNTGGYGSPNAVAPTKIGLTARFWTDDTNYANVVITDSAIITPLLTAAGVGITKVTLGMATGTFASGIHHFKYYPFETINTIISLTQDSKVVAITSGSGADTWNAGYVAVLLMTSGGTVVSNVLMIDKTAAMTSSQFTLNTAWSHASVTGYTMKLATEADLKVLFTQLAVACISAKIAYATDRAYCEDKDIADLMDLTRWKLAADIQYERGDYDKAHSLAVNVELECNSCTIVTCNC